MVWDRIVVGVERVGWSVLEESGGTGNDGPTGERGWERRERGIVGVVLFVCVAVVILFNGFGIFKRIGSNCLAC